MWPIFNQPQSWFQPSVSLQKRLTDPTPHHLQIWYSCLVYKSGSCASHSIELIVKGFVDGNFDCKFYTLYRPKQGPRNRGGMGHVSPPHFFFKVKRCPFFWAKVPHLKNEKSISWMNALSFAGKKVPFLQ